MVVEQDIELQKEKNEELGAQKSDVQENNAMAIWKLREEKKQERASLHERSSA